MRKLSLATAFLFTVIAAQPAQAITGRFVEDVQHPFVGLAVFYDASGEFMGRCSGSLLSPSVFLTAGHCVEGATSARVYFQQDAG
ncbi:MAG: trypsin-like serine protease, partial [Steroidobacteraceae bacterium]